MDARNETTVEVKAPSLAERLALVHAYQQQALARAEKDPLGANLGMIAGDLMSLAHGLGSSLPTQLARGEFAEESSRSFARHLELHLKVVRQIDRLAQLEQRHGDAAADLD
jgi:hypothetical protein